MVCGVVAPQTGDLDPVLDSPIAEGHGTPPTGVQQGDNGREVQSVLHGAATAHEKEATVLVTHG